eukprot:NODE_7825_length_437_cov_16.103093_g6971_i0.p2 GENE.NODE_7825_length_437_cov_16.103093_g6971_i0~~NODE_7825_length_437_cov_16.103093_g6971_i0.p2  ORF type:complete len:55 (-),score=8.78 NODE_7825_length_437_cov_16.103093_g6971_i0:40-204(-)
MEGELAASKAKTFTTSAAKVGGAGPTLEKYRMDHLNIKKSPDLMPCPRKPPAKK